MKGMLLHRIFNLEHERKPLELEEVAMPEAGETEILIKVSACGVCHTELDEELDYPEHLWLEKEIKSVANVARRDVKEFLTLAAEIPILPEVQRFPLEEANKALLELKERKIRGAKVLTMNSTSV